jgi:hypothetical protein
MDPAGYSGTPLPRKLGLKDGQWVAFIGLPEAHADLARAAAFRQVDLVNDCAALDPGPRDVAHLFTTQAQVLAQALQVMKPRLAPAGMFWISWPKKAAKVPADITEDVIRDLALPDIWVDVKVCAVDSVWSGLKLVIRREYRASLAG